MGQATKLPRGLGHAPDSNVQGSSAATSTLSGDWRLQLPSRCLSRCGHWRPPGRRQRQRSHVRRRRLHGPCRAGRKEGCPQAASQLQWPGGGASMLLKAILRFYQTWGGGMKRPGCPQHPKRSKPPPKMQHSQPTHLGRRRRRWQRREPPRLASQQGSRPPSSPGGREQAEAFYH